MKKFFYLLILIFAAGIFSSSVFADESQEAVKFFKQYVNAANNYDENLINMYAPDAKIIRQVIKPDGTLVNVDTDTNTYIKQLRIGQKSAKFRRYKNTYTNITSQKVEKGYKISSLRQPSGEKYKLKTYMIVQKQPDGKWLIVEELMQTKVQTFLKYAKR